MWGFGEVAGWREFGGFGEGGEGEAEGEDGPGGDGGGCTVACGGGGGGVSWVLLMGGYLLFGAKRGVTGMMWLRLLSISCRFGFFVVGDRRTDWVEVYCSACAACGSKALFSIRDWQSQ
jgi:hypothetical protein